MTMKVKEALENLQYGTNYQLVGAKTGKTLFRSWTHVKNAPFEDSEVASIRASVRTLNDCCFKIPEMVMPIVVISISGL